MNIVKSVTPAEDIDLAISMEIDHLLEIIREIDDLLAESRSLVAREPLPLDEVLPQSE